MVFDWRALALPAVFCCLLLSATAQDPGLQWQPQLAPGTPGNAAIMGGPGDGPEPNSPLYICRAAHEGGVYPGKWIKGNCAIPYEGQEIIASDYELAIGHGDWGRYQSGSAGLIQTGKDADGSPLYSCRTSYRGYQPGILKDGKCNFSFDGREIVQRPPFEVLYVPGAAPAAVAAAPSYPVTPVQAGGASSYSTQPALKDRNGYGDRYGDGYYDDLAQGGGTRSCRQTLGWDRANNLVRRCLKVSTATHPPCNVDNSCSLIRDEIRRSCAILGPDAPRFCEQYQ